MSTARIPPISCADLARHLPALWERHEALDVQARAFASHTLERHTAGRSLETVSNRIIAVEDMILAGTPATLADYAAGNTAARRIT